MTGKIIATCKQPERKFGKISCDEITLIEGLGVEGDIHKGSTNQHEYIMNKTPDIPNLRQVHLIQSELFLFAKEKGFKVKPGNLGENLTTEGIDLFSLPEGSLLNIGETTLKVTGLRVPCSQINSIESGLLKALTGKDAHGNGVLMMAIMATVLTGGKIKPGDTIQVTLPKEKPFKNLAPV